MGCNKGAITEALKSFSPLPHRMQLIKKLGDICFYNDSKATNIEATINAANSLENIFWLAGGVAKEGGISKILPLCHKIKAVYLFGESKNDFAEVLEGKLPTTLCKDLTEAFYKAATDAKKKQGEVNIILSPAAASFDQFQNFEERGNKFIELVMNWSNN